MATSFTERFGENQSDLWRVLAEYDKRIRQEEQPETIDMSALERWDTLFPEMREVDKDKRQTPPRPQGPFDPFSGAETTESDALLSQQQFLQGTLPQRLPPRPPRGVDFLERQGLTRQPSQFQTGLEDLQPAERTPFRLSELPTTRTAPEIGGAFPPPTRLVTEFEKADVRRRLSAGGVSDENIEEIIFGLDKPIPIPTLTWMDKAAEVAKNPLKIVPFLASGKEIYDMAKLLKIALDLEADRDVSREDLQSLRTYVQHAVQNKDFSYKVADVVGQLFPFAGEFLATAGVYSVGSQVTKQSVKSLLKRLGSRKILSLIDTKLGKLGIEGLGVLGGGTARTLPIGALRVPASTLGKQLQSTLTGDEESIWESTRKALGETWVEVVSESTGGLFGVLAAPIKGKLVKVGLLSAMKKANPTKSVNDINSIIAQMGYNGVFGEMLEERIADVGHGILSLLGLSDQEFQIPSREQLAVELVAFSVPGAAQIAATRIGDTEFGAGERGEIGRVPEEPEGTRPDVTQPLYHITPTRNVESVLQGGLESKLRLRNDFGELRGEDMDSPREQELIYFTRKKPDSIPAGHTLLVVDEANIPPNIDIREDVLRGGEFYAVADDFFQIEPSNLHQVAITTTQAQTPPVVPEDVTPQDVVSPTEIGQPIIGRPNSRYRAFDEVDAALGTDVSVASTPFGFGGAYEIEIKGEAFEGAVIPHRPDTARGTFNPQDVTRVFYHPEYWAEEFKVETLARDLPRLREMFPNAEFVRIDLADDAETRIAVTPELSAEASLTTPAPAVTPVEPIGDATQQVDNIQASKSPETVPPAQASFAHVEMSSPDGPKIPSPPGVTPTAEESSDILGEIAARATQGERPDQTLLRRHEGVIGSETTRANVIVTEGSAKLKNLGIGITRRAQLIPRPKDIPKLDALFNALHNPSKVESGEIVIPQGFEEIYQELRALTNWEESARLDFDPEMATVQDYFYRGWKPPENSISDIVQGRPLVRTPSYKKLRANATYQEMRDAGFEPLFWNPYQQWASSRIQGVKYREQMKLVEYLKGIGNDVIRPHDGGPVPEGFRVPEVGPAFEGKPFAMADPVTGEPSVLFSRRWIAEGRIANSLESIYGKRPDLGKFIIMGKTIDPLTLIDAVTFIPKRAKLFLSFFQPIDFLTRSGGGGWARFVDELQAGHPIEAIKAPARYPVTAVEILQSYFSPSKRLSLAKQLNSTTPLVSGREGVHPKGILEAGLSQRDVTILPSDMDKVVHQGAEETGVLSKGKAIVRAIGDFESAMRRGLFEGVYPAAIMTDIKNNIAPMIVRQYPNKTDAQICGEIARLANIKYSTIPASQSVIQNRVLRETLRRVFFSIGESEGLLRQAAGAIRGPNASYWRKHWLGVYIFLIATANVIHWASTREPLPIERYSPIAKDSWGPLPFGYNREFAAPDIPIKGRGGVNLTLDLAGQMDTAFRVFDPVNFITSRESVPVRSFINQINGTDFYGAPINDVGPGGVITRTSQLVNDLFAPIGLGGIGTELLKQNISGAESILAEGEERLGIPGLAVQATGFNIRAETTRDLLNRFAQESGFEKADGAPVQTWADLEPFQKKDLSNNEELQTELGLRSEAAVVRQQLKAEGFATLDELDQERIVRGEALVTEFDNEEMDADIFRDQVTLLKREIFSRKAQVDADYSLFKDTGVLPKAPNKRALTEFYDTYDKATKPSGVIDWEQQEGLEKALRAKWTGTQEAYVDRNIGLTEWGPLMAEYHQALKLLESYWEVPEGPDQADIRKLLREVKTGIDDALVKWYGHKPIRGLPPEPRRY